MNAKVTGGCLCGGVTYAVVGALRDIVVCHCEQCRRTSGHFVAATACRKAHFTLINQASLKWFSCIAGFRRSFCCECGSSLFFEEQGDERISIAAGSLDQAQGLKIAAHIYTAEAGDYYSLDDRASVFPGGGHTVPLP
ncbi:GFA family protein [Pseudomonas paeninsulae]|uniref:GFA family protein n=1 Tax=Pseudomonas paeninsulae TaxID=3110772 RepID=UPI002D777827|nr:GFA family protein [Pseudomonas sp. IT1137]